MAKMTRRSANLAPSAAATVRQYLISQRPAPKGAAPANHKGAVPSNHKDAIPVAGEMSDLVTLASITIRDSLADPAVWMAEATREGAAPLPWPLKGGGDAYARLLRWLALGAVEHVLEDMATAQGVETPPMPDDGSDLAFQVVLRVCKRAVDAADAKVRARYGGTAKITQVRDFWSWMKKTRMDEMARAGLVGKAAAKAAGLGVASSYRAQHRKPKD